MSDRPATDKQVDFCHAIAEATQVDVGQAVSSSAIACNYDSRTTMSGFTMARPWIHAALWPGALATVGRLLEDVGECFRHYLFEAHLG